MFGRNIAGLPVIDSHHVEARFVASLYAALGHSSIQQDNGDFGLLKQCDDGAVGFVRRQFELQGRKEDSRYFAANELLAISPFGRLSQRQKSGNR